MDVFELGADPSYGSLVLADQDDRARFSERREPQRERWAPVSVVQEKPPRGRKQDPLGDVAYFSPTEYAISQRALETLGPALGKSAEFLELTLPNGRQMFALHVLDYADDALDEANTTFARRDDGTIQRIREPAFLANQLHDRSVFGLTHMRRFFVTDKVLLLYESAGLSGLSFIRYTAR